MHSHPSALLAALRSHVSTVNTCLQARPQTYIPCSYTYVYFLGTQILGTITYEFCENTHVHISVVYATVETSHMCETYKTYIKHHNIKVSQPYIQREVTST